MEKITGNEPINAVLESWRDENPEILVCNDKGLTIRQHFAAMAMQGILSNQKVMNEGNWEFDVEAVCSNALLVADTLIKELNK